MRICLVYDCVYPLTIGGAERWYRELAERLVADGHEVTYLTRRQWDRGADAGVPGVEVVAVSPRQDLYVGARRRTLPPILFGLGVLWHLLRRGRRYDVVHTCAFPYFSLLAAGAARPVGHYGLVVDWFEVWSRSYWTEYLGAVGGLIGWTVQWLCLKVPQRPMAFARVVAARLRREGVHGGEPVLMEGLYRGPLEPVPAAPAADPVVVFAGRHIPEKRVPDLIPAIALARESVPELRAVVFGEGPDREEVERLVDAHGLRGVVSLPGFVEREELEATMASALCMTLPSRREGYGIVVVEASSHGTPSVVVAGPDNAATELVDDGVNGVVAAGSSPEQIAAAIVAVHAGGEALRASTADWFARNAERISVDRSIDHVSRIYAEGAR